MSASASLLQRAERKNDDLIRDRAEALPRVDGTIVKGKKSMRKFVNAGDLGKYTVTEMLHCIQNQKEEKKNRRKEDGDKWTRVSEFIETEEEALQGDIKCKEQVKALQLEEGTPEYDAVLWERFLKKWYSSHPEEEAGGTHASEIMRLLSKITSTRITCGGSPDTSSIVPS